jgi:hypothetical protein
LFVLRRLLLKIINQLQHQLEEGDWYPQLLNFLLGFVCRYDVSAELHESDFFETGTGNCRLMSQLCIKLSGTVAVWRKLVAPWTEYVAQALWSGTKSRHGDNSVVPTRLTQRRRTEAKGKVWTSRVKFSKVDHLCRGCGKRLVEGRTHCGQCAVSSATERLIDAARVGRQTANGPEAQLKRTNTQRQNALAQHSWKPSDQPPLADREVLFREDSTTSCLDLGISYWSTNLRFALVRWPPSRGLSAASEAMASTCEFDRSFAN